MSKGRNGQKMTEVGRLPLSSSLLVSPRHPNILTPPPPSRWIWEYSIFTALVIVFGILRSVIFFEGAVSASCHYLDLDPAALDPDPFIGTGGESCAL